MGSNRTKHKRKAETSVFDQAALAKLTARLDKSLPSDPTEKQQAKRKRSREGDDNRGSKKRQIGTAATDAIPRGQNDQTTAKPSDVLLEEILALGGDKEDYDLVAGLDSDNEGGQESREKLFSGGQLDESLRDELAEFAASLGFEHLPSQDTDTDHDSDAGNHDQGDDDAKAHDARKDEVKSAEDSTLSKRERNTKSSGKLVSKQRAGNTIQEERNQTDCD